jgi:hypothetical protein
MPNTFTLIASSTVGSGGTSAITFSSIPSTYTDLKVVYSLRSTNSDVNEIIKLTFNGTTSNRSVNRVEAYGSGGITAATSAVMFAYMANGNNATTNTFGNGELYVTNYAGSTAKSSSTDGVNENNATEAIIGFANNLWNDTAVITSITFEPGTATKTWMQHSTAYLYGIVSS